jgi:crotonobetaine/carnitine-CoA ligase
MAKGYFGMPEVTLKANRNLWFHTGDVGFLDNCGDLHFLGRQTERIRTRGENVSALEIEEVIDSHPAVEESAVTPVPNPMGEDDIQAFVTLRVGTALEADELEAFCAHRMAKYMVPAIAIVPALPKTPTGKVSFAGLLREYGERSPV